MSQLESKDEEYGLERIICFFIEEESRVKDIMSREGWSFPGFLRTQIKAVYNSMGDPYSEYAELDISTNGDCFYGHSIGDKMPILTSELMVRKELINPLTGNPFGILCTGYDKKNDKIGHGAFPVQDFSNRMAEQLLKERVPYSVHFFTDSAHLYDEIRKQYHGDKKKVKK